MVRRKRLHKEPSDAQYVPIERYKQNLIAIINHPLVKAQSPKIIMFTPAPLEETMLVQMKEEMGVTHEIRKAKDAREYATVVREVGKETGVAVLDIWTILMKKAGWDGGTSLPGSKELGKSLVLEEFLYDGLHLSATGYRTVYDAVIKLIIGTWPEQHPANIKIAVRNSWDLGWDLKGASEN